MKRGAKLALIAVMALAACSSPSPSSDKNQSNGATSSASAKPTQATVFVAMMDSDKQAVEATVDKTFARYRGSPEVDGSEGDLVIPGSYTKPFYALLDRWVKAQPAGEIDSILSDADWVCQCQDWPGTGFKFLEKTIQPVPDPDINRLIEAVLRFDLGDGEPRKARIVFAKEDGKWRITDLFSPDVPKGVVAQMTSDLARWEKK